MEKYYFVCENWDFDINQWTIFIGIITTIIGLTGFTIAFMIYSKQRQDASKDAHNFFINSLPYLNDALENIIKNLQQFVIGLKEEKFNNPTIPASLNNNIINKVNLIDLKRYYVTHDSEKLPFLEQFIIDSDFFGTYQSYFTNELNFFRQRYLDKEQLFSKWQLLRSNVFFSSITSSTENIDYKNFYSHWVMELNGDREIFDLSPEGNPLPLKSRKKLVEKHIIKLAQEIFPFIEKSEKANNVNLLANQVKAAYLDMDSITSALIMVFEKDIKKFKKISENIEKLLLLSPSQV